MKILHVIQHFKMGGIEKHVLELSSEQINDGNGLTVMAMFGSGVLESEFNKHNIETVVLDCKSGHDIMLYHKFKQKINLACFDIIHFHIPSFILPFVFLFNKFDCAVVYTDHITKIEKKPKLKDKLNNYLNSLVISRYIAVSNNTMDGLNQHYDIDKNKIAVVNNGISAINISQKIEFDLNHLNVGIVCRLEKDKGCLEFIELAKIFVDENVVFHIFGTGSLLNDIQLMISKYNLKDNVILHGFVNNPRDYIRALDIFFILSEAEALPLTIIEAFSEKTPIIGFNPIGGVSEMVEGIYNLHNNRYVNLLVEDLFNFLNDEIYRTKLEEATLLAFDRFSNKFSSNRMFLDTKKVYESI